MTDTTHLFHTMKDVAFQGCQNWMSFFYKEHYFFHHYIEECRFNLSEITRSHFVPLPILWGCLFSSEMPQTNLRHAVLTHQPYDIFNTTCRFCILSVKICRTLSMFDSWSSFFHSTMLTRRLPSPAIFLAAALSRRCKPPKSDRSPTSFHSPLSFTLSSHRISVHALCSTPQASSELAYDSIPNEPSKRVRQRFSLLLVLGLYRCPMVSNTIVLWFIWKFSRHRVL